VTLTQLSFRHSPEGDVEFSMPWCSLVRFLGTGSMHTVKVSRKRIQDIRCPDIKGLSEDNVHALHRSFVDIIVMHRSGENLDLRLNDCRKLVWEGYELLDRLRSKGL
jgi:hypothetical protein